jgi:hypothetical protein
MAIAVVVLVTCSIGLSIALGHAALRGIVRVVDMDAHRRKLEPRA